MKLTPKQKAFADYYIECGNAAEAARRAGYEKRYAGQNADKLLKNTNISVIKHSQVPLVPPQGL